MKLFILIMMLSCAELVLSKGKNSVETISEIAIIGNTELPNKVFELPWRLPSVDKRENESPTTKLKGFLSPIEPFRYRQQLHFSRYLRAWPLQLARHRPPERTE